MVLYIFDKEGNHIKTNHWFAGVTSQADPSAMRMKLDEMIAELGRFEFSDIEVKPFQTVIDGVVFGLVPDEEHETQFNHIFSRTLGRRILYVNV